MARNAFFGLSYLGTHPAFTWDGACLRCPICGEFETTRTREYDEHFLAHNPTRDQGERWLSGKTFDRVASKQGWEA